MKSFKMLFEQLLSGKSPKLVLIAFPLAGLFIIAVLPFLLTRNGLEIFDYTQTGPIGDTIGGIAGPIIAFIASLLTFLAFWVQLQANKAQAAQFNKQDIDTKIERFESNFYELIKLHKENVQEITLDRYDKNKIEKRHAFNSFYREFKYSYFVTKSVYNEMLVAKEIDSKYDDRQLVRLAYILFYSGVGKIQKGVNIAMIKSKFNEKLYNKIYIKLLDIKLNHQIKIKDKTLIEIELPDCGTANLPESYPPFPGYFSKLGHYYRHLLQIVKFVVNQDEKIFNLKRKEEYLATLRAQLSDHEQLMLYYRVLAGYGNEWLINGYFTKYKMIYNLPLPLANFAVPPTKFFQKEIEAGQDLFEWENLHGEL